MTTSTCPRPAISVRGLTKRYARRTVVVDLDLDITAGAVTGLVGPNGAGKTTIMAMLLGLVTPTAGEGTVLGRPLTRPQEYLSRVGAIIETPALHPGLTGAENLTGLAMLGGHDRARIPGLLAFVGLPSSGRVATYSLGMRQRLGIAAALLPDPELVVLDEPSNGVDPAGMRDLRALVRGIADQGRTVLVSSHLLGELEPVCDDLVVLDRGVVHHAGALTDLPRTPEESVVLRVPGDVAAAARLAAASGHDVVVDGEAVLVRVGDGDPDELARALAADLVGAGLDLVELGRRGSDLESRCLALLRTTTDARPATTT